MKFNIKHFFQYNRITKDNEENFQKKQKKKTIFFTYLDERHSGDKSRINFRVLPKFYQKNEHRNDVISRKIMIQQELSR